MKIPRLLLAALQVMLIPLHLVVILSLLIATARFIHNDVGASPQTPGFLWIVTFVMILPPLAAAPLHALFLLWQRKSAGLLSHLLTALLALPLAAVYAVYVLLGVDLLSRILLITAIVLELPTALLSLLIPLLTPKPSAPGFPLDAPC